MGGGDGGHVTEAMECADDFPLVTALSAGVRAPFWSEGTAGGGGGGPAEARGSDGDFSVVVQEPPRPQHQAPLLIGYRRVSPCPPGDFKLLILGVTYQVTARLLVA